MVGQGSVAGQLAERTWSLAETKKRARQKPKKVCHFDTLLNFRPSFILL